MEVISFETWIILSLVIFVGVKIFVVIRNKIDESDDRSGIKIQLSRKKRIKSIWEMLLFSFIVTGLTMLLAAFLEFISP